MTNMKPVIDLTNEEFETYLLAKYGTKFNIVELTEEEFARFEKTAAPAVVEIMRGLRAS
jgi:hypothetical protein